MNLMKEIVCMESQLQEAVENGELDLFIEDQHKDLKRLLIATMYVLHKTQWLVNQISEGENNEESN